jgi:hypothetical protein
MKKNKKSGYYVPTSIQKFFVGVISSLFVIQFIFLLSQGVSQYQQNTNLGGFYGFFFTLMLVPLLLFTTAFTLNPRSLKILERSFESILIALSGVIAWSILSMLYPAVFIKNGSQYIESYARYEIVASSLLVLVYDLILFWLRSTKRWQ